MRDSLGQGDFLQGKSIPVSWSCTRVALATASGIGGSHLAADIGDCTSVTRRVTSSRCGEKGPETASLHIPGTTRHTRSRCSRVGLRSWSGLSTRGAVVPQGTATALDSWKNQAAQQCDETNTSRPKSPKVVRSNRQQSALPRGPNEVLDSFIPSSQNSTDPQGHAPSKCFRTPRRLRRQLECRHQEPISLTALRQQSDEQPSGVPWNLLKSSIECVGLSPLARDHGLTGTAVSARRRHKRHRNRGTERHRVSATTCRRKHCDGLKNEACNMAESHLWTLSVAQWGNGRNRLPTQKTQKHQ